MIEKRGWLIMALYIALLASIFIWYWVANAVRW
jgi:hypothetical protein